MIVAGLTGSIAMGKSTVAAMFAAEGVEVFDADAAVHAYYASDDGRAVEAAFPGTWREGKIDRAVLAMRVAGDPAALARLEAIVHPAVAERRAKFLAAARAAGRRVVVLDIPLLFETGAERSVDCVILVSAPQAEQRRRALARTGMTPQLLDAILARQTHDADKRRGSHVVIDTSGALERTRAQARDVLKMLAAMAGGRRSDA